MIHETLVLIRGAGDLASGVAWRLHRCGFSVVMTERAQPLTLRRRVAFAQAVFDGEVSVEEVRAQRVELEDVADVLEIGEIPLLIDPDGESIAFLEPLILVDAIMAKENLGTRIDQAERVIGLGPGFQAGVDVHAVIETMRGHQLGRVIWSGAALPDTGQPGSLSGEKALSSRVLRAPVAGCLRPKARIGELLDEGALIAEIEDAGGGVHPIYAPFAGLLRGLIHEQVPLSAGLKIGDLDPRCRPENAFSISDKALAIAGGVLEAILSNRSPAEDLDTDLL